MEWNSIGMRSKGRPKNSWADEVFIDLTKLKMKNWTYLTKKNDVMILSDTFSNNTMI
jgi:hypothetical protein